VRRNKIKVLTVNLTLCISLHGSKEITVAGYYMNINILQRTLLNNKFSTSLAEKSDIISAIKTIIRKNHLSTTISDYELTLILDEVITNAMEHGNNWYSNKKITVSVWIDNISLHIAVEDEGEGFDYENFKSECAHGNKLANRGRGLIIIKHFCKPVWMNSGRLIELEISLENNSKNNQKAV